MHSKNDRTAEPSMEDILASIRKIIAEDPAPVKSGPVGAGRGQEVAPVAKVAGPEAGANAAAAEKPAVTRAPPAAAGGGSRLSDKVRELAPMAVPVGSISTANFQDDLADLIEGDETPRSEPEKPASSPAAPASGFRPAAPRGDLGAFIPSTAEPIGMTSPRPAALSVGHDLRAEAREKAAAKAAEFNVRPPAEATERMEPSFDLKRGGAGAAAERPSHPEPDPVAAAKDALGALAAGLASPAQAPVPMLPKTDSVPAVPEARKTLDDAIVEMLRPLIRDWLDANLPEMVDKALRQELSERGSAGKLG